MPTSNIRPPSTPRKRIAVIGSGFGGIAAAIRLASQGADVRIFEMRDQPGGRAYVYRDHGFVFDAGPTVITAPECIEELFTLSHRKMSDYISLLPVKPFYRLMWEDGYVFDYSNDDESLFQQIQKKNPSDVENYKRFLNYSKEVFQRGYTELAAQPFLNIWSMVKVSPQLIKLRSFQSVYSIVSNYIKDPHLRQAFSFHSLLVGGNPYQTSSIYTLIHYLERNWGVYFPKGGTGALVQALVKLFQDLGGSIQCNAMIDEILETDSTISGVRLASGEIWPCEAVVSNGDIVHTYRHLLRKNSEAQKRTRTLEKSSYSMSLFLIYFGTNKSFPKLSHHNVIFGPRYKELLQDIFDKGVLPEDFSLYLHAPSMTDPDLAPPGHHSFYVLSPVAHKGKLKVDWSVEGPKYAEKILTYLEEKYMPGLKESLVTQRIFTPDDFQSQLGSHLGSAFSLEPLLTQSAYFRQHNKDQQIRGLYFAGAGTHPGAGVPGVINSAKATAGLVIKDLSL